MQDGRDGAGVLKLNYGNLLDEANQWTEIRSNVLHVHPEVENGAVRFDVTSELDCDKPKVCGIVGMPDPGSVDNE